MKIIESLITSFEYRITYEIAGMQFVIKGKSNKFFNEYARFGYKNRDEFVIDIHNHNNTNSPINKAFRAFRKSEGYKQKRLKIEARTLANELKDEHPTLSFSERYDMAWDMLADRGKKITWKYLKEVSDSKLKSIRHQKLNKVISTKIPTLNKHFRTLKDFYETLRLEFDWSVLGLSNEDWTFCTVLKGNSAIIGTGNRLVSYNNISREGFILDGFDMMNLLFNMSLSDVLIATNCSVDEYELYQSEKQYYQKILASIDTLYFNPAIRRTGALDVFEEIVAFGISKINTINFKGSKNVFFYSIKHILENMDIVENKANIAKIGNKLNMLCAVGLLQKVMGKDIPESLYFNNGKGYDNNYFIVPNFDIQEVEKMATKLRSNHIGLHNISFKTVSEAFNFNFAVTIFNRLKEVSDNLKEAFKHISTELMQLFKTFCLETIGYVSYKEIKYYAKYYDDITSFNEYKESVLSDDDNDDMPF